MASLAAPIVGQVVGEAAKTGGNIITKVLGTVVDDISEWWMADFRNRQADIKLARDKKIAAAQAELNDHLLRATTSEEIRKAWQMHDMKVKETEQAFAHENELLKEKYAREDVAIKRKETVEDADIERKKMVEDRKYQDFQKISDKIQNLMYMAPTPEIAAQLAGTLANMVKGNGMSKSIYGKGIPKYGAKSEHEATAINPYVGEQGTTFNEFVKFFARRSAQPLSEGRETSIITQTIKPKFKDFFIESEYDDLPEDFKNLFISSHIHNE